MKKNILAFVILLSFLSLLSGCNSYQLPFFNSATQPPNDQPLVDDSGLWLMSPTDIWNKLQHTSLPHLRATLAASANVNSIGWLKLAILSKEYSTDINELKDRLIAWRKEYPNNQGNELFFSDDELQDLANKPTPKHIALLLPLRGTYATQGKSVRNGFLNAYYEALSKNHLEQKISFYDTSLNPNIIALYNRAIADGADFVIGPLLKEDVLALMKRHDYPVTTIELNYTDLWLGTLDPHLYQFGLSPQDEAQQAADKAARTGRLNAIIIAPDDDWGKRVLRALTTHWQDLDGKVIDIYRFSPNSNLTEDIASLMHVDPHLDRIKMREHSSKAVLEGQRRQDFNVIFLLAKPDKARQIVPLLKYYYAENIPIFATSSIYAGSPSPAKDTDLNGVYFCDIPWTIEMSGHADRLFAVGRDVYLLSSQLNHLIQLPNLPIYAATGALYLTSQQQIYRRLPWARIHDGHP